MSMDMMSLAAVTRVDPSLERGRIHRKGGALYFHSQAEREAWLWAIEQYRVKEQLDFSACRGGSLEAFERTLVDGTHSAFAS